MPTVSTSSPLDNDAWIRKIYAYMAHRTESGDRPNEAYSLKHAGQKSGYSIGLVQVDLAGEKNAARDDLVKATQAWLRAQGKNADSKWVDGITAQLQVKENAAALSSQYREEINGFLATAAGHILVDRLSREFTVSALEKRGESIFTNKAASKLIQDPQSMAWILKTINAGDPKTLKDYLDGKEVELAGKPESVATGGLEINQRALARPFVTKLKKPGHILYKGATEKTLLNTNTDITVSQTDFRVGAKEFFLPTPQKPDEPGLILTVPDGKDDRVQYMQDGEKRGIDVNGDNKKLNPEAHLYSGHILFKDVGVFSYTNHQRDPKKVSAGEPLTPEELRLDYAPHNQFSSAYRKAYDEIYVSNPHFFANVEAMPDISQEIDWSIWYGIDPANYLQSNIKSVIQAEWEAKDKGKRPLDSGLVEEYLKSNRRVMAEMVRTYPPAEGTDPTTSATHPIAYRGADGTRKTIFYRIPKDLAKNGREGLAKASRSPSDLATLDVRVGSSAPSPSSAGPSLTIKGTKDKQKSPKSERRPYLKESVKPKKNSFEPMELPLSFIPIGGPTPLARPPGPSTAEQLAQAADEQQAAEVAAFEEEERLGKLVRGEIERYARRPRHGWTPFEEAVLCGATIHNPNGYRHRDFGGPFG